ncbi:MAG: rhodanese-like domain-containing protein [Chloroflexota bacterium]
MAQDLLLSPAEAAAKVDAGAAIVLDVVSSSAWRRLDQAIPGAVRIPPEAFSQRWSELPRAREIIAYCT